MRLAGAMFESMLLEHLKSSKPGEIRTFVCDNVTEVLSDLELSGLPKDDAFRIAVCRIDRVAELEKLLDGMVHSLAEIAVALFPFWYGGALDISSIEAGIPGDFPVYKSNLGDVCTAGDRVSIPWLKAAAKCAQNHVLPLPRHFAREIQASQLALAIGCEKLSILVAVDDAHPGLPNLIGLVKGLEWLSRVCGAPVSVLIPRQLAGFKELDSILYDALALGSATGESFESAGKPETKHVVWPIEGEPHPLSPGEQELAKWIAKDPELAGLFGFNQTVATVRESRFLVDLLWPQGKVVVEVDGYNCHSGKYAFCKDRNRDYELVISGYLVLRLPHDEVLQDVMIAVDKIRDVVKFRRQNSIGESEGWK
jgi:very-short-patch-repair endonuclease